MSENHGGPAFPAKVHSQYSDGTPTWEFEPGMTLRDYFASAALTALASVAFKFIAGEGNMTAAAEQVKNQIAPVAFSMADAMLAERDKA